MKKLLNFIMLSTIMAGLAVSMPVMVTKIGDNPMTYTQASEKFVDTIQVSVEKVSIFGHKVIGVPEVVAQAPATGSGPDVGDIISDEPVPIGDVAQAVVDLIHNYKGMGAVGIAGAIIMILIMLLRTTIISGLFKSKKARFAKRVAVIGLGGTAGMFGFVTAGLPWLEAAAAGYISSGVAIAIFELVKAFVAKPEA